VNALRIIPAGVKCVPVGRQVRPEYDEDKWLYRISVALVILSLVVSAYMIVYNAMSNIFIIAAMSLVRQNQF
jgi:hypothetical protein